MNRFIIEADGGSRGNPGPAAFGALVYHAETQETFFEVGMSIGIATNNVAEYRGLIAGLKAVSELDLSAEIEVRMDSKLVVEQMSGNWKVKHQNIKPLVLEAKAAFPPEQVKYVWVPREENFRADALLNKALDELF
ncbi:MAG: reverse transcriptase-like protein [Candidatus Nanopelagicales bacterium]